MQSSIDSSALRYLVHINDALCPLGVIKIKTVGTELSHHLDFFLFCFIYFYAPTLRKCHLDLPLFIGPSGHPKL